MTGDFVSFQKNLATRAAPTDGMSRLFCILFNVKLQNSAQLPLFPGQSGFSGRAFFSH